MIVVLHAKSPERFGLLVEDYPIIYCISMLCRVATPLFFFLSALLFYKGCCFNDLERKYKSRIDSLLIPYLLWNIIFVAIFWVLSHVPILSSKMNMGAILSNPKDILIAILDSHHTDLWFVKDLMAYTILAPVLLLFFKNKKTSFILLSIVLAIAIYLQPAYKSLLRWLPIYMIGAAFGYYWNDLKIDRFVRARHRNLYTVIALVMLITAYLLALYKNTDIYLIYISPILIWFIVDGLFYKLIQDFRVKKWMSYMFFVFCTHHFVLNVLQKIVVLCFDPTPLVITLTYFLSPILCVFFLIKSADLISHYKVYKILSGGR